MTSLRFRPSCFFYRGLVLVCCLGAGEFLQAIEPVQDYRFKIEVLAVGMPQPLELKLAPDGRIFFNEIKGALKIWKPSTHSVVQAGTVPTFAEQENGFLGFALDPGFAASAWIYIYYSPTNYSGQRLSRFVMKGDLLDSSSEKVLLEFGEQRLECCHHAGSVQFGPDGNLYISTGDNTHPFGDSASYGPMDERPGREPWDSQKGASNTQDLRGKILRLHPTPEGSYSIPKGNLFPPDGSKGRPEIFVMGCRNPWRMSVDQQNGIVYWGEVGPDASNDSPRGARGYDEINQARSPGNYGWPYFVGNNFPYSKYNYATRELGPMFDPDQPVNNSPNNTGAKMLPPARPAMIYWPYGKSEQFPELGEGGRTACAGPVFHFRPEFSTTDGFPKQFDNCLLFFDWQRPFIKWARLDDQSHLVRIEPFTSAVVVTYNQRAVVQAQERGTFVIKRPEDCAFGPDGCLYMIDYGATWGANPDSQLLKISYQRGNIPPVAMASATPKAGREPLAVSLSSEGSKDFEGDKLQYEWRLHPGNKLISRQANPRVILEHPGNYVVELVVNDGRGGEARATLPLVVGNTAPRVRFTSPQEGDFFTPGKPVSYQVLVEDEEDGSSKSNEELMDSRNYVSGHWSKTEESILVEEQGLVMMKQSDCFNCHALTQRIVGPALLDVANKYRGQPDAMAASVQRVIKGSTRVWGETPMLPHEQLSKEQVQLMVNWIYALEPAQGEKAITRGLTGKISVPDEPQNHFGLLEATYTDFGRAPAGCLVGKGSVKLRGRRVEAEESSELLGAIVQGAGNASGKQFVKANADGDAARFSSLNLSDSGSATCRVASGGPGGAIELRRDSIHGAILARWEVKPTGDWKTWQEISTPLSSPQERCDVFCVFTNPGKTNLMSLDWIEFKPR
jgi:cytochrome c